MDEQPTNEHAHEDTEKHTPYLKVTAVIVVLLLASLIGYFLFQVWSLSVSQNDEQPAPVEETQPVTTEHTPPLLEERQQQLDALKEKENPYQLSTEERRAQLNALQNR